MNSANIKELFYLNPNITYLNHGSFGACPIKTMEKYFKLQTQLENQPVQFLDNDSQHYGTYAELEGDGLIEPTQAFKDSYE